MEIRELTYLSVALRIFIAIVIGGLIGLDRGMKNRPAGLRTYMLVCLGSCLVMMTNQFVYQVFSVGDPVRMSAQVVSGIGFLGAGTIVVTRRSQVKGLTTAAGLWASAAVGLAVGIGFYEAAIAGGIGVFFVMTGLQEVDARVHRKAKTVEVFLELDRETSLGEFLREAQERNLDVRDVQRESGGENGSRAYIATIKVQKRRNLTELSEEVREIPGVMFLECL